MQGEIDSYGFILVAARVQFYLRMRKAVLVKFMHSDGVDTVEKRTASRWAQRHPCNLTPAHAKFRGTRNMEAVNETLDC